MVQHRGYRRERQLTLFHLGGQEEYRADDQVWIKVGKALAASKQKQKKKHVKQTNIMSR